MRSLKELAEESRKIEDEAKHLWETEWLPYFITTQSIDQFRVVKVSLLESAGVDDTAKLPGLLGVELVFQMDALRQRLHRPVG